MDPLFENAKKSRTPVAWIQEICAKQGNVPQWEILDISQERGSQLPIFKATVTLIYKGTKLTAEAEYRSKKEVKQHAASKMLDECMQLIPKDYWELAGYPKASITPGYDSPTKAKVVTTQTCGDTQHAVTDPKSTSSSVMSNAISTFSDSDIGVNPISDLALLCETLNLGVPDYNMEAGSDGPAHNRRFEVECKVGNESKTEWSKTKKQAKRRVAYKWIVALKGATPEIPVLPQTGNENEGNVNNTNALCDQVNSLKLNKKSFRPPCSGSMEECLKVVSHQNHVFQRMSGKLITQLKEGDVSSVQNDPVKYLENMGTESNFTLKYTDHYIADTCMHSTIILLTVNFVKDVQIVLFGVGSTPEMAHKEAAMNVLKHIQTVAR